MKRLKEEIDGLDEGDLSNLKERIKKREKEYEKATRAQEKRKKLIKGIRKMLPEDSPLVKVLQSYNEREQQFTIQGTVCRVMRYINKFGVSVEIVGKSQFYRFYFDGHIEKSTPLPPPPPLLIMLIEHLLDNGFFRGRIKIEFKP